MPFYCVELFKACNGFEWAEIDFVTDAIEGAFVAIGLVVLSGN